MDAHNSNLMTAVLDFRKARRQAAMEDIIARLTGKSNELLSFDDVRQKLRARGIVWRGRKEVPLDAIVGSVGRYGDFSRSFLPLQDSDQDRWAKVKVAFTGDAGVPPIEVYQIGDAYFVADGNHRVSVARELGATHIEAYVTEFQTKVPLSPDVQPDDLIVKAEQVGFLERTGLDSLRPEADLSVTVPGQYKVLEEQIDGLHADMYREWGWQVPYEQAVTSWYDEIYMPVVRVIRQKGILKEFPGRTETDLYVWVSRHHEELENSLEWELKTEDVVTDLATRAKSKQAGVVARVGDRVLDAVVPDELEAGPEPGEWRRDKDDPATCCERLFDDVLVPVSGKETGWQALTQALQVARREGGRVYGLHVVPTEEQKEDENALSIQKEFNRRCKEAGITGNLAIDAGVVSKRICERSRWTDLVVVNLAHPPEAGTVARLASGFRSLIRTCPRPVLAVPSVSCRIEHALLAYDGSRKSEEALFAATYLAGKWGLELAVVTVKENGGDVEKTLEHARQYLERCGVRADYLPKKGEAAGVILGVAKERETDLIIMGGYGSTPVVEIVLGSAVDRVLRESRKPILICR